MILRFLFSKAIRICVKLRLFSFCTFRLSEQIAVLHVKKKIHIHTPKFPNRITIND